MYGHRIIRQNLCHASSLDPTITCPMACCKHLIGTQAKEYMLKSYLYYQRLGEGYGGEALSMLWRIFDIRKYGEDNFEKWVEDELEKVDIKDEVDFR